MIQPLNRTATTQSTQLEIAYFLTRKMTGGNTRPTTQMIIIIIILKTIKS